MAHPTQHPIRRAARVRVAPILALLALSACAADPGDIESESIAPTSTTVGDGGEASSTTGPDSTEPGDDDGIDTAVLPGSLWGVEAGSYDLIRLDIDSGDIVQRIGGWGAEAGSGGEPGGGQALQQIAAAGDNLWVADCCEPAVGTVFRVDPATTTAVPDAGIRVNGTTPVLSPDGDKLAVAVLDIGIAVHDAGTGEMLVSPELIGALISPTDGLEAPVFAAPVSWIDGDTIAVAVNSDETSTVTLVSVTRPPAPIVVGSPIEVSGPIIDGATRSDGALVLAVESPDGSAVAGQVYSTETGAQDAAFTLDPATTAIDYDASGTFLLVARENLPPAWQGLGRTGQLGDTPLVFAAWDDA